MMTIHGILGTIALLATATLAQAQTLTVTGTGENFSVEYDAGHVGNIVGGGAVRWAGGSEENGVLYQDARFLRRPAGIPMDMGGESQLVYLPQAPASTLMSAR